MKREQGQRPWSKNWTLTKLREGPGHTSPSSQGQAQPPPARRGMPRPLQRSGLPQPEMPPPVDTQAVWCVWQLRPLLPGAPTSLHTCTSLQHC